MSLVHRSSVLTTGILALVLGACGAAPTEGESTGSSSSAVTPAPQYFTAKAGETLQLTPSSGYVCVLESVSGAFDYMNTPAVGVYVSNGSYWLKAGMNTTASAACVAWNGTTLGTTTSMEAQIIADAGPNDSLTGYQIVTLDPAAADACFLFGIQGDWLVGQREPMGVIGRVNGAWVYPSGGVQDFQVLSNGMGLTANAGCYAPPHGASFHQTTYTATYLGPKSVPLPNASNALCGLTGIQGGFNDYSDVAAIVRGSDGSQTLQVNFNAPTPLPGQVTGEYLWATATCLSYDVPPPCSATTSCAGIIGAPPNLIATCASNVDFYRQSPGGTRTFLGTASTMTDSTSSYDSYLVACTPGSTTACASYSEYETSNNWCPAPTTGGSGGSVGGGGAPKCGTPKMCCMKSGGTWTGSVCS